jgi:hypothetical protein
MLLNATGDLYREAWNEPHGSSARCLDCAEFGTDGVAPETVAAKARAHVRATGHRTRVNNHRITEYSPGPELQVTPGA